MRRMPRGFTLVETLVCLAVLAIAGAAVLAALGDRDDLRVRQAEELFRETLATGRLLAARNPARTLVVEVDADGRAWWIAEATTPDVPLARAEIADGLGGLARVRLGEEAAEGLAAVRVRLEGSLRLDRYGGLDAASDATVRFVAGDETRTITVRRATGVAVAAP
jgi:prepilin-type N-terminal cleavage/methylation domain-containing protein